MISTQTLTDDSESVLRYMRNKLGLRGKIGIYGRSLGGIASAHLAKYVDLVFIDRSLSNLERVIDAKFMGESGVCLYKFGTCGAKSNND